MQLKTIQKLGGLSIIIGSVLLLAYSVFFFTLLPFEKLSQDPLAFISNVNYTWISVVAFIAVILLIFGFGAIYSKLYAKAGMTGLIGFVIIELAYLMQACQITWEIFIYPVITGNEGALFLLRDSVLENGPSVVMMNYISLISLLIGVTLFCITLFRSKDFPKLASIFFFAGVLMYGLGPMIGVVVAIVGVFILSVGCSMLGWRFIK